MNWITWYGVFMGLLGCSIALIIDFLFHKYEYSKKEKGRLDKAHLDGFLEGRRLSSEGETK